MAKVTGPLMSMDASGAFGGALVFGKWKGRNTVHQLVTPSNPNSANQEAARNDMRVAAAVQRHINLSSQVKSGKTGTDKARISGITPAGYAWNGHITKTLIGAGGLTMNAVDSAWTTLNSGEKSAWDTAADGLSPAYGSVYQTQTGGGAGTAKTAGYAFFAHQYALYAAGLDAAPTGTPPTYA